MFARSFFDPGALWLAGVVVAGAAGAFAMVVIGGVADERDEAVEARDAARRERDHANAEAEFLRDLLGDITDCDALVSGDNVRPLVPREVWRDAVLVAGNQKVRHRAGDAG